MAASLEQKVVSAMLWAAYGDALGFICELADVGGVIERVGDFPVHQLMDWTRNIGGRFGASVPIMKGMYSDDTQLRLATCRAYRNDGTFDVEAFSKVELPVWQGYALGAGRASKAAARNLSKRPVTWLNNYYSTRDAKYISSGGNGAMMRVQPHAWRWALAGSPDRCLSDVLRNVICTHGHARAHVGAAFHCLCVMAGLEGNAQLDAAACEQVAHQCAALVDCARSDPQLGKFWLPVWEQESRSNYKDAIQTAIDELVGYLRAVKGILQDGGARNQDRANVYRACCRALDAYAPDKRGDSIRTAVLSQVLVWLYGSEPDAAMIVVANELGTDTDTIATVYGALAGIIVGAPPPASPLDAKYMTIEARRLVALSKGHQVEQKKYPDLFTWDPPKVGVECVRREGDKYVMAGLALVLQPQSDLFPNRGHSGIGYRYFISSFGQTFLCAVRADESTTTMAKSEGRRRTFDKASPKIPKQTARTTKPSGPHRSTTEINQLFDLLKYDEKGKARPLSGDERSGGQTRLVVLTYCVSDGPNHEDVNYLESLQRDEGWSIADVSTSMSSGVPDSTRDMFASGHGPEPWVVIAVTLRRQREQG